MTIHMDPFDLGEIKLVLTQSEGRAEAQVFAQDERVRQALAGSQGELARTLDSRGIRLDTFQVGTLPSSPSSDFGPGKQAPSDHPTPRLPQFQLERPTTHVAPIRIKTTALDLAI
jgi:hypothetical protein